MLVERVGIAVSGDGVHAAGDTDAEAHDFIPVNVLPVQVFADGGGHQMDGGFVGFHHEGDVVLEMDKASLEVGNSNAGVLVADGHAYEIAGFGIESVDGRPAATGGARLAQVHHETFTHEFSDQLGGGRNGGSDGFRNGSDTMLAVLNAKI